MKHVKTMSLPDCDKLIYSSGMIARQIGVMIVVDDEDLGWTESYPIISGGQSNADGNVLCDDVIQTKMVCHVGEKITPHHFAEFVKRGMHEEVPATAWELYQNLRENGSDLVLPVLASNQQTLREYKVELEFHDFKEDACCYSTDNSAFFFEVYYERGDKDDVFNQLHSQLMDYINILDTEELGCKLIFTSLDTRYMDVIQRLNEIEIGTNYCEMRKPRR